MLAPNHIIIIGPSATLGSEFNIVKNGSITLDKNLLQYKIIPIIKDKVLVIINATIVSFIVTIIYLFYFYVKIVKD